MCQYLEVGDLRNKQKKRYDKELSVWEKENQESVVLKKLKEDNSKQRLIDCIKGF